MASGEDRSVPVLPNTVDFWRAGEQKVRQQRTAGWGRDYDVAIASAVVVLEQYHTIDDLQAAYCQAFAEDDWVAALCRLPSGRVLNRSIVEDAAYWRRLKQLVRTQPGERRSTEC